MGVGREIAVVVSQRVQTGAHQDEMFAFLLGDAQPVGSELFGQRAEAVGGIQGEVNGVELYVRNGVQHGGITFGRVHGAFVHRSGGNEFGAHGAACSLDVFGGRGGVGFQAALAVARVDFVGQAALFSRVGFTKGAFQQEIEIGHGLKSG